MKIILNSTQAETAYKFCDSWHIITVEIYGYLHDVGYQFCIRGIEADEIGTTPSQLKAAITEAKKHILDCWDICNNDYAYSHKQY